MATITLHGTTFETSRTDLRPLPIDPSWIKKGDPVARSVTLSKSPDGLLTAGLWDCTAGTFTWIFRRDEIVHILEGEVRVHDGPTTHVLVPGSVAYFPCGTRNHLGSAHLRQESVRAARGAGFATRPGGFGPEDAGRGAPRSLVTTAGTGVQTRERSPGLYPPDTYTCYD